MLQAGDAGLQVWTGFSFGGMLASATSLWLEYDKLI
jgi:hypothetical protein